MWDSRPRYDCPAISKSSCSWTPRTNALIPNIKANIAGYVVRRELSKYPNDQIAVEKDLEDARSWFDQKVGASEEAFQRVIQQAEREILQDLQDPKVVEELWQEAARFVAEVFPQPVPKPKEPKAKYVRWDAMSLAHVGVGGNSRSPVLVVHSPVPILLRVERFSGWAQSMTNEQIEALRKKWELYGGRIIESTDGTDG